MTMPLILCKVPKFIEELAKEDPKVKEMLDSMNQKTLGVFNEDINKEIGE